MTDSDSAMQELKRLLNPPRKAFLVYVDLDPVPGTFHTPYSAYLNVKGILELNIPHYDPTVILASSHPGENEDNGRKRVCFVVYVNLDPQPGDFHTQESAQHAIRVMLHDRLFSYNPLVSLAPASVQPINIEGNN